MDRKLSLLGFAVMFLIGSDTFVVAPLLPSLAKAYDVAGWSASMQSDTHSLAWCPGRSQTEVIAESSLRLGWWSSHWQQQAAQFPRDSGQCSPSVLSLAVLQP